MDPQLLARMWLGQAAPADGPQSQPAATLTNPHPDPMDDDTNTDDDAYDDAYDDAASSYASGADNDGGSQRGADGHSTADTTACCGTRHGPRAKRQPSGHRTETTTGAPAALAAAIAADGDPEPAAAHQPNVPVPQSRQAPAAPAALSSSWGAPQVGTRVQRRPDVAAGLPAPVVPQLSLGDAAALEDASTVVPFTVIASFDPSLRAEAHYVGPPGRRRAMAFTYDGMVFTGVAPLGQAMVATWRAEQDVLDSDYPPGLSRWGVRTALWLLVRCGGTVMSLAAAKDANLLASGGRFLRNAPVMDTPGGADEASAAAAATVAVATSAAAAPASNATVGAVIPARHDPIELPAAVGVRPFVAREDVRASLVHVVMPPEPAAVAIRRHRQQPAADGSRLSLARAGTVRFVFDFRGRTFLSAKALASEMLEACRAPPPTSATTASPSAAPGGTAPPPASSTTQTAAGVATGSGGSTAHPATDPEASASTVVNGVRRLVLVGTGLKLGDAVLQRRFPLAAPQREA